MARKHKVKPNATYFSASTFYFCDSPSIRVDTDKVEERQTVELGVGWIKPQCALPHKLRTVPSIGLPFRYIRNVRSFACTTGTGWAAGVRVRASGCGGGKCPSG